MATYQTVEELEKAISKALQNDVAKDDWVTDALKLCLDESIGINVYGFPEGRYVRRMDQGGLGDKTNMDVYWDGQGFELTIEVVDNAPLNPYGGNGKRHSMKNKIDEHGNEIIDDADDTLAYYVEHGKGRGNMAIKRPFYKPADALVEERRERIESFIAETINEHV